MYRGSKVLPFSLILAASLLLAACKPPEAKQTAAGGLSVAIQLGAQPSVGTVPVEVTVTKAGAPVLGAKVRVEGDMTHAGMPPVIATAEEAGEGRYVAAGFGFTMAGDWVVTVTATAPDGAGGRSELLTHVAAR